MAIESVLARQYVEFAVRGLGAVSTAMGAVRSGLQRVDVLARAVRERLSSVVPLFAKLGALGAAFTGIFGRAALKDTEEADDLNRAFTALAQTIGEIFVPYIRRLTEFLELARTEFANLSPETKNTIAQFVLIGTAVAGVVVLLPPLLAGFGAVTTVVAALASPLVLIPALLIGAGAAFLYAASEGENFEEKLENMPKTLAEVIVGLKGLVAGLKEYIITLIKTGDATKASFKADRALEGVVEKNKDFLKSAADFPKTLQKNLAPFLDAVKQVRSGLSGLRADATGAEGAIARARDLALKPLDFRPPTPKPPRFAAGFESLQGTFERLQKGLLGVNDDQRRSREALEKIAEDGVKIKNPQPVVF